jgi:hypothetical protein
MAFIKESAQDKREKNLVKLQIFLAKNLTKK